MAHQIINGGEICGASYTHSGCSGLKQHFSSSQHPPSETVPDGEKDALWAAAILLQLFFGYLTKIIRTFSCLSLNIVTQSEHGYGTSLMPWIKIAWWLCDALQQQAAASRSECFGSVWNRSSIILLFHADGHPSTTIYVSGYHRPGDFGIKVYFAPQWRRQTLYSENISSHIYLSMYLCHFKHTLLPPFVNKTGTRDAHCFRDYISVDPFSKIKSGKWYANIGSDFCQSFFTFGEGIRCES